jgi:hypothetical protein
MVCLRIVASLFQPVIGQRYTNPTGSNHTRQLNG